MKVKCIENKFGNTNYVEGETYALFDANNKPRNSEYPIIIQFDEELDTTKVFEFAMCIFKPLQ